MRKHKVHIIRAFTAKGQGGNPAGVALHADHLSRHEKQAIAAQLGLSETAFISASESANFKLEFFTPNRQIAHCGHATVASFGYLMRKGLVKGTSATRESIEGVHPIRLEGEKIFLGQEAPAFHGQDPGLTLRALGALGLDQTDLWPGQKAEIVSTGVPFLLVPLKNDVSLRDMVPRFLEIEALSEDLGLVGFYPFYPVLEGEKPGAVARMFAPRYAITEESATGMAAGPLGSFLHQRLGLESAKFWIRQGLHMPHPSPSELEVQLTLEDTRIQNVWVGGEAVWQEDKLVSVEREKAFCA